MTQFMRRAVVVQAATFALFAELPLYKLPLYELPFAEFTWYRYLITFRGEQKIFTPSSERSPYGGQLHTCESKFAPGGEIKSQPHSMRMFLGQDFCGPGTS
jgi:hypothetical protein